MTSGSIDAQLGRREVEHQVVRADHDDRPLDLLQAAQQRDLDLLARVMALHVGRDDEQPVGADQRGQHAGAAGQRRRDQGPADAPEPDPHPVVDADRGRQLAGQSRRA